VAAELVVGGLVAPVLGERLHLDRAGADLRVEADVQRQVVGQPAVERQTAALVGAQEVDLARSENRAGAQRGDNQHAQADRQRSAQAPARRRGGTRTPAPRGRGRGRFGARRRRGTDRGAGEPGLLSARADQRGVLGGRGLLGLGEAECDHGDVVAAAGLVRLGDEQGCGRVEAVGTGEDLGDPALLDHRGEPVGAQQIDIPGPGAVGHRVDLDHFLGPERAGDDRALRVILCLLVGEPALAAKLLDQRVVRGQQAQLAVAVEIGAAVADVGEADLLALEQGRGQGRTHARDAGVLLGHVVNAGVRLLQRPAQERLRRLALALAGLKRLDRYLRGDLARLGAAHAVGDRKQGRLRVVGVLVSRPLAPGVGPERLLDHAKHA
jgi:hypothetical protein